MMYVRFPLSLRNVEDLLYERRIDVCHESVRLWVDRFGTLFAKKIGKEKASYMRQVTQWQWHLDEVFVKINGVQHFLWRAVDHECEACKKLVVIHSSVYNHFNHQRNIESRTRFKRLRNAALLEWREFTAA